jgi:hypothetical protein
LLNASLTDIVLTVDTIFDDSTFHAVHNINTTMKH